MSQVARHPYRIVQVQQERFIRALRNGIALDPQGNVVVVNGGHYAVLTFSPTL